MSINRTSIHLIAFVSIVLILSLLVYPVFAYPSLSGSIKGPDSVTISSSFELQINVRNSGNTPAYGVTVELTVPSGFKTSSKNLYFGDIKSGESKSQIIKVSVLSSPSSGTFSGLIKYSDNIRRKGTSIVMYMSGTTIKSKEKELGKNLVTFQLYSVKRVTAGWVTIYDSKGGYVTTGGGKSECSACPTKIQIYLPEGKYKAAAAGQLDGCKSTGFCNAVTLSKKEFTVNGNNAFADIFLTPMP